MLGPEVSTNANLRACMRARFAKPCDIRYSSLGKNQTCRLGVRIDRTRSPGDFRE